MDDTGWEWSRGGDTKILGSCDDFLRRNCSIEMRNSILVMVALLSTTAMNSSCVGLKQQLVVAVDLPKIEDVCHALAPRAIEEINLAHAIVNGMEEVLGMEVESIQAFRILLKIVRVNERPEFGIN